MYDTALFCRIFTGSAVHKKLAEVISRPRLLVAIRKLSNYHQRGPVRGGSNVASLSFKACYVAI